MRASWDTKEEEVAAVAEDKTELTLVDREAEVVGSDSGNMADLLFTCCPMVQKERNRETKTSFPGAKNLLVNAWLHLLSKDIKYSLSM